MFNENVVQWALAVRVGGYTITAGFADAYEYFTLEGYVFATAFRAVPYAALGGVLVLLSKTRWRDFAWQVFIGGLLGSLGMPCKTCPAFGRLIASW